MAGQRWRRQPRQRKQLLHRSHGDRDRHIDRALLAAPRDPHRHPLLHRKGKQCQCQRQGGHPAASTARPARLAVAVSAAQAAREYAGDSGFGHTRCGTCTGSGGDGRDAAAAAAAAAVESPAYEGPAKDTLGDGGGTLDSPAPSASAFAGLGEDSGG